MTAERRRLASHALLAALLLWTPARSAWAQLSLVSRAQVSPWPSAAGNASTLAGTPFTITGGQSVNPSQLSADGRYVVFQSLAPDLASGVTDRGSRPDVFIHDRLLQATTLLSRAAGLPQTGNGYSMSPSISADGMFVAFLSSSTNLVPGMTPGSGSQVFLWSRATDSVTLVSHAAGAPTSGGNGSAAERPAISADGRYVAYASKASNLAAGQSEGNVENDVFLYSQASNTNVVVSHAAASPAATANGRSFSPALSADGSTVAYESFSTNLVVGQVDTNGGIADVFVYQRASGQNRLVSHALASSATTGNDESGSPALNADGSKVVFSSLASNLLAATDTNGSPDAFLFDTASGGVTLVSHVAGMTGAAAGASFSPVIDDAGTLVAFLSNAHDLVAGQVDPVASLDVFVCRLATGVTTLVTHLPGQPTTAAAQDTGPITDLRLAAGGRYVLYGSDNPFLTAVSDTNGTRDYFLFDATTGLNRMATAIDGGTSNAAGHAGHASLSADGEFVAFDSYAGNVITTSGVNDHNAAMDVFLFDASAGETTLLSLAAPGLESVTAGGASTSDGSHAVSADGRYAVFTSDAQDLGQAQQDLNDGTDVFLADLSTGEVRLVSHSIGSEFSAGTGRSYLPAISADGSRVAFLSEDSNALVPNLTDTNGAADVFVWERDTGLVRLVSHSAASSQVTGNGGATTDGLELSSDGRFIAYASYATNLVPGQVDTNTRQDAFLYDATTGASTLVSHAAGLPATTGDGYGIPGGLSADGRYLVFVSSATNVVAGQADPNSHLADVFLYDRLAGATTLLSHPAGGPANTTANGNSSLATLSADGSKVALLSDATNLVPGFVDGNGTWPDLYLLDRASGAVALASHSAASAVTGANHFSSQPELSADGQWLTYISRAANLVSGQTGGGERAAFLYSAQSGQNLLVSHAAGSSTQTLDGGGGTPSISADGAFVAFASESESVVPGQTDGNSTYDVFLYRRADGTSRLLSRVPASASATGDDYAFIPSLSAGGLAILFYAQAGDLLPTDFNARSDVFVAWNEQTPPSNPTLLQSDTHAPSTWARERQIHIFWSGAADVGSGLRGYSIAFDTSGSTTPDTVVDVLHIDSPSLGTSSTALPDGASHSFHLRTCDQAGNCSSPLHTGPYWIDATAPTAPTGISSTSHTPGVPSSDATIDVVWTAGTDATSGLDGYGISFSSNATPHCSQLKDVEENVTSFTSDSQPDGNRWAHVCTRDNAGNWSQAAVAGPYRIATQADLGIEQSASPEPLSALGTLSYDVTVTNHGGLDASGVVVTDTLPAGLEFVSSTPGEPTCTHAAGLVTCALGALPFEASATVTIRATNTPGFIGLTRNVVRVDGAQPDGNATNDAERHDVLVVLEKGDLDNDAWPEILFRNAGSGRNVAWLMQGTLKQGGGFLTPDPARPDWRLAVVHDVDGDQRNDLAFWNQATGAVEFWLMNGLQRTGAPLPLMGIGPLPAQWTLQASADFDHDGQADLLWRNALTQALTIWRMNGAQYLGTLTPNPDHATDANWQLVAALDLSDDGNADLLWYNRSSGRVVEWLMDANVERVVGRFTDPSSAGNANWKVVGAANYGGDSSPLVRWNDLLWRNETTGKLVVWQMNAQGMRLQGLFTTPDAPAGALGWQVVGPR